MAQASRENDEHHSSENKKRADWPPFKLNAAAPEFVPRAHLMRMQGYVHPPLYLQYPDRNAAANNWIYFPDRETPHYPSPATLPPHQNLQHFKENTATLTEELKCSIIQQAEYMFSDLSLLANESFTKHMSKDHEGYVPVNFVTMTKQLKSLNVTNHMVAKALMSSSTLVVSNDGKKVRRKQPFTEKDKEELQMRTVIAENLPDNHSIESIEKLFHVVGNVKSIRICQPQEPNTSKSDAVASYKLRVMVEYENAENAEKAAEKLNDERHWRKGMRVRVMLKRSAKAMTKGRRSLDGVVDEAEATADLFEVVVDETSQKGWLPNRGKPPKRTTSLPPATSASAASTGEVSSKQTTARGPRMPDGTRGFTLGRGKPLFVQVQ
ncbi:hypothetical protein M569_00755 [Genlisea aurea]|uniref:HTH La-type RNA-binding domain-containing protein n=1 Tax=Genlisea aurea TaxID=192259 RepID=S8EMT2_9LAMI|nr:hypothetical protein M569_00755 [Genlisea aurea]